MVDFRMLADNIPVLHCPSGTDVEISKENYDVNLFDS